MPESRAALAFLALALAFGCNKKPPAPAEYTYRLFVEGKPGSVLGLELDGKALPAGKQEARGMAFEAKIAASELGTARAFQVVVATSCGSEKLAGKLAVGLTRSSDAAGEKREREQLKPGEQVLSEVQYAAAKIAKVFLDADGAPSAKVEVGQTALDSGKAEHEVAVGSCAAGREIKVDGKPWGSVNVEPRTSSASGKIANAPGTTLVDVTGKHCYERVMHVYVDKNLDTKNMQGSQPKKLEGGKVYAEEIDDFLKPSPKELTASDIFPSRNEIRRCAEKRPGRR
ncbi:MAG: hypothetical protein U0263_31465 [Polyangiaceae bacterium]